MHIAERMKVVSLWSPTQSPLSLPFLLSPYLLVLFFFFFNLFSFSYLPPFQIKLCFFCHLKHSLSFHIKRSFLYLESIFKQKSGELCFDRMSAPSGYCRETGP